jgi:hypothetical protein
MMFLLSIALFIAAAALTVRYLVARIGSGQGGTHDDGIQEGE